MSYRNPARTDRMVSALVLLCGGALLIGCERDQSSPTAGANPADSVAVETQHPTLSFGERRARKERGRQLYFAECSGCHGERGLGDGPAAEAIDPKPRNLVRDRFKFRSTASFQPPVRADILETISRGMPGSAMPAFDFLTDEERGLITDHVMYLARLDADAEPEVLTLGAETPTTADSI